MNAYENYFEEVQKYYPIENKHSHIMYIYYFAKASLDVLHPIYSRLSAEYEIKSSINKNMSELLNDENAFIEVELKLNKEAKKEILYILSKLEMLIRESRDTISLL